MINTTLNTHDGKGWLVVLGEDEKRYSIAINTRVENLRWNDDQSRQYFTILDWPNAGLNASVRAEVQGQSRFVEQDFATGVELIFSKTQYRLKYECGLVYATNEIEPLEVGDYDICLPDYYHDKGADYFKYSGFSGIWFRIGKENSDKYIHIGNISRGCITVGSNRDEDKYLWTELCHSLLLNRLDNQLVGRLKVVDRFDFELEQDDFVV